MLLRDALGRLGAQAQPLPHLQPRDGDALVVLPEGVLLLRRSEVRRLHALVARDELPRRDGHRRAAQVLVARRLQRLVVHVKVEPDRAAVTLILIVAVAFVRERHLPREVAVKAKRHQPQPVREELVHDARVVVFKLDDVDGERRHLRDHHAAQRVRNGHIAVREREADAILLDLRDLELRHRPRLPRPQPRVAGRRAQPRARVLIHPSPNLTPTPKAQPQGRGNNPKAEGKRPKPKA
mmetsp:Transcript_19817/g.60061  ORF Transcript_19817/g.60061 Transcript_19817/m.60061 type:complete len:238 (+) Transcript_19817:522-1235(+)